MGYVSREVQIVLLCEDRQHQAFVERFLESVGRLTRKAKRRLRVEKASQGRGSAERFVRDRFPKELAAYRRRRNRVSVALVVMLDGDAAGVNRRLADLDAACVKQGTPPRQSGEDVFVFVPTWRIETWLAWLKDGEPIDEKRPDYPRLPKAKDCQPHARALADMCRNQQLPAPIPPSLAAACTEYGRWN